MRNLRNSSLSAGIIVASILLGFSGSILPICIADPAVAEPKITMNSQTYTGYAHNRMRHELSAPFAEQDAESGSINLKEPRVLLQVANGEELSLRAAVGVFDHKARTLRMQGDVVLTSMSGKEVVMSEALIKLSDNTVISSKPVEVKSEQMTIHGNRLETTESGYLVIFDGTLNNSGVVVRFNRYIVPERS